MVLLGSSLLPALQNTWFTKLSYAAPCITYLSNPLAVEITEPVHFEIKTIAKVNSCLVIEFYT
jgi:hypothetical protein